MLTNESRIHEIDGLRGIAILSVVIFHLLVFPLKQFISSTEIVNVLTLLAYGVDLFFVISGFLIGTILLKIESYSGIRAFYVRRILRIWPLYYLLLFLVYSVLPDKSMLSAAPTWSFFLFIFNFWESYGIGIHQALGPLWSIAIEEQFYLLGPVIFLFLKRKQILFFLIIFVLLSPLLRWALLSNTNIDIWRFTPTRIDGICVGILLAMFLSSTANVLFVAERIKQFSFLMFLLLALLPLAIIISPDHIWASFGHSLIVFAFGCVLMVVQVRYFLGQRISFLNWGFLRYFGLRCYSIYLFHTFFVFMAISLYDNFYVDIIIEVILILLFAHLSWKYIEMPFIKFGRKFSYKNISD